MCDDAKHPQRPKVSLLHQTKKLACLPLKKRVSELAKHIEKFTIEMGRQSDASDINFLKPLVLCIRQILLSALWETCFRQCIHAFLN